MVKKSSFILVGILFYLTMLPASVVSAAEYPITGGAIVDISTYAENNIFQVADGASVTFTGTRKNIQIICGTNTTLIIQDLDITNSAGSPIVFNGTGNTLMLVGANVLNASAAYYYPAIQVEGAAVLTIDSELSGTLTTNGGQNAAGIGGRKEGDGGTINIAGGTVTATGGEYGAGIGGGHRGNGGTINISSGTVTANGKSMAAGIGGGWYGSGGTITISGGTVTAESADSGVGIGGGAGGSGGSITISDGEITATGGEYGAGIGGGNGLYGAGDGGTISIAGGTVMAIGGEYGAGIGGGWYNSGGAITISGGTVMATGGTAGAGIGGGNGYNGVGDGGTINIIGGVVTATAGQAAAGIGGGSDGDGGTINISGGTVTANGGASGAGIGGGSNNSGGTIAISGGTVTATGGDDGAGIGGGDGSYGGNITISAGEVTAKGGHFGAGIGGGWQGGMGFVSISGGIVFAEAGATSTQQVSIDQTNNGLDIGKGYESKVIVGTLTISGSAAVFLRNDRCTTPVTTTHTHLDITTLDEGTVYGIPVQSGWTPEFGAYLPINTLSFDANGGTGTVPDIKGLYRDSTTIPEVASLTRIGYRFIGWNTAPDGSGTTYAAGSTFTFSLNTTLYAKWTLTNTGAFISRFYELCLGRGADQGGLSYWTDALDSGSLSGADAASNFIYSSEFVSRNVTDESFITIMYKAFFNRTPDAGGKAYWLDNLSSGVSRRWILSQFVNSEEFSSICSSYEISRGSIVLTDPIDAYPQITQFVTRFYRLCLNRDPEYGGLSYWVVALHNGERTGAGITIDFILGQEFTNKKLSNDAFITIMYKSFFGRDPDADGKTYWLGLMNAGVTRQQVLAGFVNSTEFNDLCTSYRIVRGTI